MNVLKMLKKDHSNVQNLFGKFDRAGKSAHEKKAELFEKIRRELQLHSRAEEEIFYPALKAMNQQCSISQFPLTRNRLHRLLNYVSFGDVRITILK